MPFASAEPAQWVILVMLDALLVRTHCHVLGTVSANWNPTMVDANVKTAGLKRTAVTRFALPQLECSTRLLDSVSVQLETSAATLKL
jgi:hypothetical protein